MIITLHLTDGRKITKDRNKLIFFDAVYDGMPEITEGCITVNLNQIIDIRPAEDDEIEHARIHGW